MHLVDIKKKEYIVSYIGRQVEDGIAVDRENPVPIYLQVVNWISNMLQCSGYDVGSKLPSEGELAEKFQLNRNTIRHAISVMVQQGLLEKQKGVGTFVRRKKPLAPVRQLSKMTSFIDDFELDSRNSLEAESQIISQEKIIPYAEIAAALDIPAGEFAIKIERVRIADKTPFLYEIQYYSFEKFNSLLDIQISGSMYQILIEKYGVDLDHSIRTLQAVRPSKDIASKLMISRDIPCIFYKSRAFNAKGECLEVLHSYYRGDRYVFQVETGSYVRI